MLRPNSRETINIRSLSFSSSSLFSLFMELSWWSTCVDIAFSRQHPSVELISALANDWNRFLINIQQLIGCYAVSRPTSTKKRMKDKLDWKTTRLGNNCLVARQSERLPSIGARACSKTHPHNRSSCVSLQHFDARLPQITTDRQRFSLPVVWILSCQLPSSILR